MDQEIGILRAEAGRPARADRVRGRRDRRCRQGQQRRPHHLHAADVRRVPRLLGERHALPRAAAGDGCEPAAGAVRVGAADPRRLHEREGREAAGHARAAGELRARPPLPHDRVLLRDHVQPASPLLDADVR